MLRPYILGGRGQKLRIHNCKKVVKWGGKGKNQDVFNGGPPTSTQKLGWLAVELVCVLANTIAKLQNQAVLDCKNAMFFAYCNFFLTYPVRGGLP